MRKLKEVEDAKALMTEAMEWSVFRWLFEKRRVRETADEANAALDRLNEAVKARWRADVRAAYQQLNKKGRPPSETTSTTIDPEIRFLAKKVKEADDAARRARTDAENTFDDAERQLNTDLAREGCKKAIHQWELDEKAIRVAEAAPSAEKSSEKASGKNSSRTKP